MKRIIIVLLIINIIPIISYSMENKPYHHLSDGTFRNPEGSPQRDSSFNWSFKIFNAEKKKLNMEVPKDHVIKKDLVLESLKKYKKEMKHNIELEFSRKHLINENIHINSSTPVLLVHGEEDDIVPFSSLENAKKLLIGIGFDVKTVNRPGLGHGIDPDGISAGMDFVKKIINF